MPVAGTNSPPYLMGYIQKMCAGCGNCLHSPDPFRPTMKLQCLCRSIENLEWTKKLTNSIRSTMPATILSWSDALTACRVLPAAAASSSDPAPEAAPAGKLSLPPPTIFGGNAASDDDATAESRASSSSESSTKSLLRPRFRLDILQLLCVAESAKASWKLALVTKLSHKLNTKCYLLAFHSV